MNAERKLIGQLADIHPALGTWAAQQEGAGLKASEIKAKLVAIIEKTGR